MFGARLRLARKKAGLSMKKLAERLSPPLTAQAISKYERGQMLPKSSVLVQLGRELDVSLDFLLGGRIEKLTDIQFRKSSRTSVQDEASAETIVTAQLEDYCTIEEILGMPPAADPFDNLASNAISHWEEIEEQALWLREKWVLGDAPITSMIELLETKNVKVIEADLPARFDGLACTVQHTGNQPVTRVIVVSHNTTIERKRFNLAHEVAHHVVCHTNNPDIPLEKAMNRFAAAFLVSRDHLKAHTGEDRQDVPYRELISLKWLYGISASAMLMRLGDVGILTQSAVQFALRTYARSWRTREPEPIAHDGQGRMIEKPRRYENLIWRALGEKLISPVRAAQMLHCSLDEISQGQRG